MLDRDEQRNYSFLGALPWLFRLTLAQQVQIASRPTGVPFGIGPSTIFSSPKTAGRRRCARFSRGLKLVGSRPAGIVMLQVSIARSMTPATLLESPSRDRASPATAFSRWSRARLSCEPEKTVSYRSFRRCYSPGMERWTICW